MRNALPNYRRACRKGFSLLELLVVITIIGVLAGILFPAASSVVRKAEETRAQAAASNLKTSISAYFTEYRKYPVEPNAQEEDELVTDETLMDVLLGADNSRGEQLNPRKIAFFSDKQAKRGAKDTGRQESEYRNGIILNNDGGGELLDPWNMYYRVRLDLDYNNRVRRPSWDNTGTSDYVPEPILVWSLGRNQEENDPGGKKADNIKTW